MEKDDAIAKPLVKQGAPVKETIKEAEHKLIKVLEKPFAPLVEFKAKDIAQVIVGSSIMAIPVGFTQETWEIGASMPALNSIIIFLISLLFISILIYYTTYKHVGGFKHKKHLFRRIIGTYVFSFLVVSIILMLIGKAPWLSNSIVALKRVVLITLPASVSAAIADMIK
jgi:uncharacterized membrane protein